MWLNTINRNKCQTWHEKTQSSISAAGKGYCKWNAEYKDSRIKEKLDEKVREVCMKWRCSPVR